MGKRREEPASLVIPSTMAHLEELESSNFIQSNPLIEAVFLQPFKELELKVLCLLSKYINENKYIHEERNLEDVMATYIKVVINKHEFCDTLKTNTLNFYKQMNMLADELTSKKVRIKNSSNKDFATICLFPGVAYKNGQAIFYISCLLTPYLRHLKREFTSLCLEHIVNMGSAYAIKIYQLLKQYQSIGSRTFLISELKNILGIKNLYLNNFHNFEKDVLTVAKKHINQFSDLKVSFVKEKIGKEINNITFKIEQKKSQFQQAIKVFTREIDLICTLKILTLAKDHSIKQKQWKKSKKNIDENLDLFKTWLSERVESYSEISTEKLILKPEKKEGEVPIWYKETLERSLFERLQKL